MGYACYYNDARKRWQGYAVAARCDHKGCRERIDRGVAYACGDPPDGGEHGCGGFFCDDHAVYVGREIAPVSGRLCRACYDALPADVRAKLEAEDDGPPTSMEAVR